MKGCGRFEGDGVKGELRTHCCRDGEKHWRPGRVGDAEPPGQGDVADDRDAAANPMFRCRGSE
jgi:hypothetical protein